jgi:hypothetical protein
MNSAGTSTVRDFNCWQTISATKAASRAIRGFFPKSLQHQCFNSQRNKGVGIFAGLLSSLSKAETRSDVEVLQPGRDLDH